MGDPNASIPTPEPVFMRPMYGGTLARSHTHTRTHGTMYVSLRAYVSDHMPSTPSTTHSCVTGLPGSRAVGPTSIAFVSQAALDKGTLKGVMTCAQTRGISIHRWRWLNARLIQRSE